MQPNRHTDLSWCSQKSIRADMSSGSKLSLATSALPILPAYMPILVSRFHPPAFLRNGHIQTILPVLLPRRLSIAFERERLELEDGDFLDLDWAQMGGD